MSAASHRKQLKALATHYGYELKRSNNHCIWQHVITGFVVTTAKSPSDHRAIKNTEARFKRGALLAS